MGGPRDGSRDAAGRSINHPQAVGTKERPATVRLLLTVMSRLVSVILDDQSGGGDIGRAGGTAEETSMLRRWGRNAGGGGHREGGGAGGDGVGERRPVVVNCRLPTVMLLSTVMSGWSGR